MLSVSAKFLQAIKTKQPQDIRLEFSGGEVITGADIAITSGGLTYTEVLNSATDVTFGRAVMSELSAVLINSDGRFTSFDFSREFTAKVGINVPNDTFEVLNSWWSEIVVENDSAGNERYYSIGAGKVSCVIMNADYDIVAQYYLRNGANMGAVSMILCASRLYVIDSTSAIVGAFDIAAGTATNEVSPTPTEYPANITKDDVAAWVSNKTCVAVAPVKGTPVWEYVPLGVFKGEKPDKVRGKLIELTAHDRMNLFDKSAETFADGLTFPCTLGEIFTKLCAFCGVGYVSALFPNSGKAFEKNPLEGTDYTCREILGYIAEAAGSYARMSRDGAVELVWFADADYTVTRTDRFEMTESEFLTPSIDRLEVYNSFGDQLNTSGTGDIVYGISDNPFLYIENDTQLAGLQPYVDVVYSRITSLPAYHPSSFRAEFNPAVQCGDVISVVDDYGETISFPVFVQTITWAGFGKTTYENTGGAIRQNAPFTQRELEQLKKKSVKTKDLLTYIESYLNTEEGVASITYAVSGKFMAAPPTVSYSTPSGVTYGFEKTSDGYYTSTNAGVDSSYSYGVFTFENNTGEPQDIILRCVSRGELNCDYGIISVINSSLLQSNTADSSGVLKKFNDTNSETPVDVTLTIPAGKSTVSFKYRKDGSVHGEGDYFKIMPLTSEFITTTEASSLIEQRVDTFGASLKLSVTNGEKSSVISLTGDGINLSGTVAFTGEVVFKSDLSTAGSTTINGANITTGKISAEYIDVGELSTKKVIFSDDNYNFDVISSDILSENNARVTVGLTDYIKSADFGQYLNLYGTQIYMIHTGYDLAAGDSDNYSLLFDMANQRIISGSSSWSIGYFENINDYNSFGNACFDYVYADRIYCDGRICMGEFGETYPCLRYYDNELRWYTASSTYTTIAD